MSNTLGNLGPQYEKIQDASRQNLKMYLYIKGGADLSILKTRF